MRETITENQISRARYLSIDLVKAITIFLVVLGHSIQYFHGSEYDYWGNWIFKWIYGFHMPLFALASGFLYSKSRKTGFVVGVSKKAKQLLLPVISWAFVLSICDLLLYIIANKTKDISVFLLNRFMSRCVHDLWFLKGVFLCCLIVMFVEITTGKPFYKNAFLVIIALSTMFWPKVYEFHLYGFLVPYYFIGYAAGGAKIFAIPHYKGKVLFVWLSAIIYLLLLIPYQKHHYIYTSGLSIIDSSHGVQGQIENDLLRFVVGIVGCIMIIACCCMIQSKVCPKMVDWVTKTSSSTLSIYVMTTPLFIYLPKIAQKMNIDVLGQIHDYIVDIVFLLPLSLILVAICVWISKKLSGKKISMFFFGR